MKAWEAPRIEELEINETAQGGKNFTHIDLNTYDENGDAVSYYS